MNQQQVSNIMKLTKDTYELIGGEFSNTRNRVWPEMEKLTKKYVRIEDKVLDLGCGNGRLVKILPEVNYLGVDGSKMLIIEAQKIQKIQENINFIKLDLLELSKLEQNKFDIVFMFASFNHLPSQELRLKVLRDIKKILKPSGKLIMTNWNMWQMGVKKNIWNYKIKSRKFNIKSLKLNFKDVITFWQSGDKNKKGKLYYRAFTKQELSKLFKKGGFRILENYYSLNGNKACWSRGKNIVTVGEIDK